MSWDGDDDELGWMNICICSMADDELGWLTMMMVVGKVA